MIIGLTAITKELVLACRQLGLTVSETLAAFVASTIANPATGAFFVDKSLGENDARQVVEESIKKLFADNPQTHTLRLQATYDFAFLDLENGAQKQAQMREEAEGRILSQIVAVPIKGDPTDFDALTALYRKIFQLLLVRCRAPAGPFPAEKPGPAVEREVAAALESVFPRVGLRAFMNLTEAEKATQLSELCSIVLGIRLFNQKLERGGQGLPSIDDMGLKLAEELLAKMDGEIERTTDVCREYAEVLLTVEHFKEPTPKPTPGELEKIRMELHLCRQFLSYQLAVQEDVHGATERLEELRSQFEQEMERLGAIVGHRTSVPKDQVYPKFDALTKVYNAAFQEFILIMQRSKLWEILSGLKKGKSDPRVDPKLLRDAINSKVHIATDDSVELPPASDGDEKGDGPFRLTIESSSDFLKLPLDFQGFCIYTLATDHALVPGNPSLGVVTYKGRFCCFANEKAMRNFFKNPGKYFVDVREVCYKYPDLIHLLRLHEDFPKSSLLSILQGTGGYVLAGRAECSDCQTETPLHIVEENIDPTYEWNEWKMRQDALHTADIRAKKTSATQTLQSSLRRESETQVFVPRDTATGTTVSSGTNPPRHKTYMTGLRGETSQNLNVVQLRFEL